jgi:carbonic anhydrase
MDMNFLAALEYAVDFLQVRHVVVCGHYGCGGVRAAMGKSRPGQLFINKWLKSIKDVYRLHRDEIDGLESGDDRARRLVELNVVEQVRNLAQTSIIQRAWQRDSRPELHGWVYGLHDGIIKEIACLPAGSPLDPIYEHDLELAP